MDRWATLTVNGEVRLQLLTDIAGNCEFQMAGFLSRLGRPVVPSDDIRFSFSRPSVDEEPSLPGIGQWRAELLVTESLPFVGEGKIAVVQYGLIHAVPDAQIRVVQFGPWVAKEGDDI